eukprot:1196431-Prorocentrum_minimum.AAC.4
MADADVRPPPVRKQGIQAPLGVVVQRRGRLVHEHQAAPWTLEGVRVDVRGVHVDVREKGTPAGVVYRAQGPALGSWDDRPPPAARDNKICFTGIKWKVEGVRVNVGRGSRGC